jgi:hypothetical protein
MCRKYFELFSEIFKVGMEGFTKALPFFTDFLPLPSVNTIER